MALSKPKKFAKILTQFQAGFRPRFERSLILMTILILNSCAESNSSYSFSPFGSLPANTQIPNLTASSQPSLLPAIEISPQPSQVPSPIPCPIPSPIPCPIPSKVPSPIPSSSPSPTPSAAPTGAINAIRTIQPVLAVRGMACLMCHAKIQANVISDFGYGDDTVYLGGSSRYLGGTWASTDNRSFDSDSNIAGLPPAEQQYSPWYNNYIDSWQSGAINGSLYVPNVQVPQDTLTGSSIRFPAVGVPSSWWTTPINLVNLFNTNYTIPGGSYTNWMTSAPNPPLSSGISPSSGNAPVIAVNQVQIMAPTESNLAAIEPPSFSGLTSAIQADPSVVSGFAVASNATNTSSIVMNNSSISYCSGDVIVKGPLFLRGSFTIFTTNSGCRIYVDGSVFIQNQITVLGANPSVNQPNLQISSTRAIMMGFDYQNLFYRLNTDPRNMWTRAGAETSYTATNALIINDEIAIANVAGPLAGGCNGNLCEGFYGTGPGTTFNYSHMLLNAPVVESLYQGQFQGIIVSEIALFRLDQAGNNFNLVADPVFVNTPIFPLFNFNILVAQ